MNISIVGPEKAGKTIFANENAKRLSQGRPIFFIGPKKSAFPKIRLEDLHKVRNAVVIIDDANSFLESRDVYNKELRLKEPFVLHREWNVVTISVFHSFDDTVKYIFRQSKYIYVSCKYLDSEYKKNKFIKGINPVLIDRRKFSFLEFKRY